MKNVLLRVDVSCSIFYLLVLISIALPIATVTQIYVTRTLVHSWRAGHNARVYYVTERISISTTSVHNIANSFMALNLLGNGNYSNDSRHLLRQLCSSLDTYDKMERLRALSLVSMRDEEITSCIHGMDSTRTLTAYSSHNHIIDGVYLIDNETFDFVQPLRMVEEWPASARNISGLIKAAYSDELIFALLPAYLNGSAHRLDLRHHWIIPAAMPHLLCYALPRGYLSRGRTDISSEHYTDFTQVQLDGSRMLLDYNLMEAQGFVVAVLINQSLADNDPLVLSNSWGQPSVSNDGVYSAFPTAPVTYLKVSEISHPFMRAALQHVDLAALQREGYRRTVNFKYDGATAVVSAYAYTTVQGLIVPIVLASSHAATVTPYLRLMRIFDSILAAVILLLTVAFFVGVHRLVSKPLRRITALMLGSRSAGRRALFYATERTTLLRLTEVHELIEAHNTAMNRLRSIDAFVPDELRVTHTSNPPNIYTPTAVSTMNLSSVNKGTKLVDRSLSRHLSTAVFISVRPPKAIPGASVIAPITPPPLPPSLPAEEAERNPRPGERLVAVVEHAAQAANTANSGPFPTPAALTAFITAVQELCHTHHGTLHRLCPDACVLHFNSAVRAHIRRGDKAPPTVGPSAEATSQQEEMRRYAAQDARNAAAFALDLVSWVDVQSSSGGSAQQHGIPSMPDVRVLLDTSMFTCGQYCPAGSEQTLQVALGRDVQRELGGVPQRIGARLATTEETATLLRAELRHAGSRNGKVDHGVRQIPVDVLCIGRAGLDSAVVVLYEVLPGRAADDAAWQLYAHCCCDGFAHMLRGDYTGALAAYRAVAEIPDLEPGLLPPSMRRESVASTATGGAVSMQVARLMRECERCVRLGFTEPLCRVRLCPLGVDRILCDTKLVGNETGLQNSRMPFSCKNDTGMPENMQMGDGVCSSSSVLARRQFPGARERHVLEAKDGTKTTRFVVPSLPAWMRDEQGLYWHLARSRRASELTVELVCQRKLLAMGSTGVLSSTNFFLYRDLHPVVAEAIKDAPTGPMSDELRSATPVCGPTSHQSTSMRRLFEKHQKLKHPNLLSALGFSESIEGGVMIIWEFSPGGTLRELILRYPRVKPVTMFRFGLHILTALSYLHERGIAHGKVCMDKVQVSADGKCRLTGHSGDRLLTRELFYQHQNCYMSPLMATGALPTPQCDMFCFGLGSVEALTKQPPWKWATRDDGQLLGTAAELAELMKVGGQPFSDALLQGRVEVNLDPLSEASVINCYTRRVVEPIIACLSLDPTKRPTAMQVRAINKEMLLQAGLTLEEDELAQVSSDEDT